MRTAFLTWCAVACLAAGGQPDHAAFDALLKEFVSANGEVNYSGLQKAAPKLEAYTAMLEANVPDGSWSDDAAKAYWMNAYNAYTLKLVTDHYPIGSITDLEEPWDRKWIAMGFAEEVSLNYIEHEILRAQFRDPRIHVGINCASKSCPRLHPEAFTEENVDTLLTQLMREFVNDPVRNRIGPKKIMLSRIFEWFRKDFTLDGTLIEFLDRYSNVEIDPKARILYLHYDWSLNGY